MIRSMTGFARSEKKDHLADIVWEIRSVNHRYLDINLRLPEEFRYLEMEVRQLMNQELSRGKVEATLLVYPNQELLEQLQLNMPLVKQLIEVNDELCHQSQLRSLDVSFLLKWPGVIKTKQIVVPELETVIFSACKETLKSLLNTREKEGENLAQFIMSRIDQFMKLLTEIGRDMSRYMQQARQRIMQKITELQQEIDQIRLEQEIAFLLQKADVAEETSRLHSHISQVKQTLEKGGAVGRRLDFFMQELNREANTIGSKSNDMRLTEIAVDFKVLIEQMREQIQNIE